MSSSQPSRAGARKRLPDSSSDAEAARRRALIAMIMQPSESESEQDAEEEEGDTDCGSAFAVSRPDGLDYSVRSHRAALQLSQSVFETLRRDCQIAFVLNSSNWLGATSAPSASGLQRLAKKKSSILWPHRRTALDSFCGAHCACTATLVSRRL